MRNSWLAGLVTGLVLGSLLVVGLGVLMATTPAEAQDPSDEQTYIMREIATSLKGIERALQNPCQ